MAEEGETVGVQAATNRITCSRRAYPDHTLALDRPHNIGSQSIYPQKFHPCTYVVTLC